MPCRHPVFLKNVNKIFKPEGVNVSAYHMQVFNRWGQLLFQSDDLNLGWDGTFAGAPCEQDMYLYKITLMAFTTSGTYRKDNHNGMFTLLR